MLRRAVRDGRAGNERHRRVFLTSAASGWALVCVRGVGVGRERGVRRLGAQTNTRGNEISAERCRALWDTVRKTMANKLFDAVKAQVAGVLASGTLMSLPTEVKRRVAEKLDAYGLAYCSCTCRELRKVCASNDLWQELLRKDFGIEHGGRDGLHARTLYNLHAIRRTEEREAALRMESYHPMPGRLPRHGGTRRRPRHLSWNSRSRARYHRGRLRFVAGRLESEPAAETDSGYGRGGLGGPGRPRGGWPGGGPPFPPQPGGLPYNPDPDADLRNLRTSRAEDVPVFRTCRRSRL